MGCAGVHTPRDSTAAVKPVGPEITTPEQGPSVPPKSAAHSPGSFRRASPCAQTLGTSNFPCATPSKTFKCALSHKQFITLNILTSDAHYQWENTNTFIPSTYFFIHILKLVNLFKGSKVKTLLTVQLEKFPSLPSVCFLHCRQSPP